MWTEATVPFSSWGLSGELFLNSPESCFLKCVCNICYIYFNKDWFDERCHTNVKNHLYLCQL